MSVEADGLVYASLAQLMALEAHSRGLSFAVRKPRASILAGRHASLLRGRGLNFEELRRYQPGDDLRHLDWRASMRYGKPFVRSFSEERDRPTQILVDQRMDMFFGSRRAFKSTCAAELAALAAWIAYHGGDRVGGLVFDDRRIERIAPLRSRTRVEALLAAIVRQNNALAANAPQVEDAHGQLDKALLHCLSLGCHGQTIVIVSDFAGAGARTQQLLRQLAVHNDVIAMQIYDPLALNLPKRGRPRVTQGDLQLELAVERRRVHEPLTEFIGGRLREVGELLRRSQVPLMLFETAEPALQQLRRELGKLGEMRR
ncbi:DUF58 domain-containing protein [Pseudomonas sp. Milli4]|uniref:DUF58 domain-containing protein n=1 Tax=Pseudomonas schmalbachii TaxID=2816993 RepID=A0ABS3TW95_9PSED|nr:DUF58 domain-containing protein [Pseudomonas schmalbachii]MBO3277956.1 DUF58 domain-containing protein [Pseudomonas schmalbachii]